jgi:hypothetical protein
MAEWQEPVGKAESLLQAAPHATCFYDRFAIERAVHRVYREEPAMDKPSYDHILNALW